MTTHISCICVFLQIKYMNNNIDRQAYEGPEVEE